MSKEINVLIVDDELEMRTLLTTLLDSYTCRTAASGIEGLKVLESFDAKLIICDLHMAEMGGKEFLQSLPEEYRDTAKIIITANPESAQDLGVPVEVFIKPFDIDQLLEAITCALFPAFKKKTWKKEDDAS